MDALSDVLRVVRLKGGVFLHAEFTAPWCDISQGSAAAWMKSSLEFAADEIAARRVGSETVLAKLSEVLFVETLRRYVESLPEEQTGWLAGLKDPFVSRALALLHGRVAREASVCRRPPGAGTE